MNLVIVEDSELVLHQLLRLSTENSRIHVTGVAASEEDAVSVILNGHPDAVLLDLSLAKGTGMGVLRRIRRAGNQAHVLILTNYPSDYFRQTCETHGIDGFFDKTYETQLCFEQLATLSARA